MSIAEIYFLPGLAMLLVVLWDYTRFHATARRLTRIPPADGSQFSRIAAETRNLTAMALFAFFLWPAVVLMELFDKKE